MAASLWLAPAPDPKPANLRLGPEGEILAWLVAGPFPNVGALELRGTGFRTDYLNPEATASAVEGQVVPMIESERTIDPALTIKRRSGWMLGIADEKGILDLAALLNGSKPGIAYCFTELLSPKNQSATLLFGSDDGAKVWLNGKQIFEKQLARGVKRDEDKVTLDLLKGANRLLFKIEQGNGGWGLTARLTGAEGVTQRLGILEEGSGRSTRWIRRAAGMPGSLDVAEAIGFDRWVAKAGRWHERFAVHTTEAGPLAQRLAEVKAANDSLNRLTSADALSSSLSTLRKRLERSYHHARKPLLDRFQNPGPQFKTDVAKEDYARVMPGGRYFVHANGATLMPIGYNHNPDWPEFVEAHGDHDRYDPKLADRYIAHVAANGVNVIRLMIETPQSGNLEERIGVFRPEHVLWIDTIVAAARKHRVKLIVTPWDTFWMNLRYESTTYNPANGGPLKAKIDFITDPTVRKHQKRRLQYMIDRWGNTGTIFCWEILNEADLWWGANAAQLEEWSRDVAGYVRQYEKGKWGRNHMVSMSFAEAMPKDAMARLAFDSRAFDYATTHLYIGASKAPRESIGPALAIQQGVRYAMSHIDDNRPYVDTENGPIDDWIESEKLDDEVFHHMSWAHLASGAAGSGFRWPYRNPHHLTEGMLRTLKAMSAIVGKIDWKTLSGRRVETSASGDKGSVVCGFGTSRASLIWASGSTSIVTDADGEVVAFDCRTGESVKTTQSRSAGKLTITLTKAADSVVVWVRRA